MKLLASTISKYIQDCTSRPGTKRFILPSYPPEILYAIGESLEEEYSRKNDLKVKFEYKVAGRLGETWKRLGAGEETLFSNFKKKGWYNQDNNLTSVRNLVKSSEDDVLIILLAGYEHIDDQASLQDFFHLDQEAIWDVCLRNSFDGWLKECLRSQVDPEDDIYYLNKITTLFKFLYGNGLADLLEISKYLEKQDFSQVDNGYKAYQQVLLNLSFFKLPSLVGLTEEKRSRKSLASYINPALDFLNYSMFLDIKRRDKYLKSIDIFLSERDEEGNYYLEEEIRGSYSNQGAKELAGDLEEYIKNCNQEVLNKIKTVDFVFINESILNNIYKEPNGGAKETVKKIPGHYPEIFLRALWLTLGEFKKKQRGSYDMAENLKSITLQCLHFRYDGFDEEEEGEEELGEREKACMFLIRILGGIDDYFEDRLRLKLGAQEEDRIIKINSYLCPGRGDHDISYSKSSRAEPFFKYKVILTFQEGKTFARSFIWPLPENHQCRLMVELMQWARREYVDKGNDALPVFGIPYLAELFTARDQEEVNRLLGTFLKKRDCLIGDLRQAQGLTNTDPVKPTLYELVSTFQKFLEVFFKDGFFSAMLNAYDKLRKAYSNSFLSFLDNNQTSDYGPLLLKAFLLVAKEDIGSDVWLWNSYLPAAVATPLHPAVLDMIHHHNTYLCESFCYYATIALEETGSKSVTEKKWDKVVDLSRMHWPVFGILKNRDLALDTNVRSYNYFHLIGKSPVDISFISSRQLLEYDFHEDEDISDTDLFRETRSSRLVHQVLAEYSKLYSYASDGISLGAYCGGEIQPLIAGIDAHLGDILKHQEEHKKYSLKLTIFSDSRDDSTVMSWVKAWQNRWLAADLSRKMQHYQNCHISIAYRVISRDNNFQQFIRLLDSIDLDMMFFMDFITYESSSFKVLPKEDLFEEGYRKFPVLEKVCCKNTGGGGKDYKRDRILSNQRFRLGALHAELMARLKNEYLKPSMKNVVISTSNFSPWISAIDIAHQRSNWVICIDSSVDEYLLGRDEDDGSNAREIIGFGTGVGPHGENNFTVSTERFAMADIRNKISTQVSDLLCLQGESNRQELVDALVWEASRISGLSVVKATGPERYVRELIVGAVVRKTLKERPEVFCDVIVSLDTYLHWFESYPDSSRPDLLRINATIEDGYFRVNAQIIECKLGQECGNFLITARRQLENGLSQLIRNFLPRVRKGPEGIGDRPDQRYWWMQLHRLLASKGQVDRAGYDEILVALERLSEGYYSIIWQGALVAIWTDEESHHYRHGDDWLFNYEGQSLSISVFCAGREFINKVCLEDMEVNLFADDSCICFFPGCYDTKAGGVVTMEKLEEVDNIENIDNESVLDSKDTKKGDEEQGSEKKEIKDADAPADADLFGKQSLINEREEKGENIGQEENSLERGMPAQDIPVIAQVPQRILLGEGIRGGTDIYWEFGHPELTNRHILVFGASGTGKTYTIQTLMWELARGGQNTLIVDYTNGFTNNQLDPLINKALKPKQHTVRLNPLPINPFRQQCDYIDDMKVEEDPTNTAQRVAGVFTEVYRLGDQQKSALYSAIREGIIREKDSFNFYSLIQMLEEQKGTGGSLATSAGSVRSKIKPFVDSNPFGIEDTGSWETLFNDPYSKSHIIQLALFTKDTARLITEFSLIDLYWFYRSRGSKDMPKVIIMDEIQNLDHRQDSPLGQFLTEGRKFGISLILATQTLSNLGKDERDRLFQASHKLFFKPAMTEIKSFAQILADSTGEKTDHWVNSLSSLKRGECYSLGPSYNEANHRLVENRAFRIKIKTLEDRL